MSLIGTYKPYSYIVIMCVWLWVTCHVDELLFDRQFSFYMKYFLLEGLTYMSFFFIFALSELYLLVIQNQGKWRVDVRTRLERVVFKYLFCLKQFVL